MKKLFFLFLILGAGFSARAATLTPASPSYADVSAAVAVAVWGDAIAIPEGSATWPQKIVLETELEVYGVSTNLTSISNSQSAAQGLESPLFDVKPPAGARIKIHDLTLIDSGTPDNCDGIHIGGAVGGEFEFYNLRMQNFSYAIKHYHGRGVVHTSQFFQNDIIARITGYNSLSAFSGFEDGNPPWGWDSLNRIVFEDCQAFYNAWNLGQTYLMDTEFPASYTVRHFDVYNTNSIFGQTIDGFDMHGEAQTGVIPLGIVIHNVRWYRHGADTSQIKFTDVRGGRDSLVYSNEFNVDAYLTWRDDPTSGVLTGNNYAWNNQDAGGSGGTALGSSTANGVTLGTHFFHSQPADFVQLGYPHPFRSAADPSAGTLSFSSSTYSVQEDGGTRTITVTRTGGTSGAVSVSYGTSNGTATSGSDYTAVSSTLSFADGEGGSKTFDVTILDNGTAEADETFTVVLSSPTGGAALGTSSATVTILNDDEPDAPLMPGLTWNAEDMLLTAPMTDGGTYISQASQTTDPASAGKAVCRFTAPVAGNYTVTLLVNAPAGNADSLFCSIDELPLSPTSIFDCPLTSGFESKTLTWRGAGVGDPEFSPKTFNLSAGEHTFYLYGREAGMQVQSITLVPPTPRAASKAGRFIQRGRAIGQ
jgi:hypothetical protein